TLLLIFFSSRRRHTRSKRDWSSDVCSSDLASARQNTDSVSSHSGHSSNEQRQHYRHRSIHRRERIRAAIIEWSSRDQPEEICLRSEERRVGKESRSRCAP